MANLTSTVVSSTEAMRLPSGTTAQRPASPSNGMIRFNTDLGYAEIYENSTWDPFVAVKAATPNMAAVVTSSGEHYIGHAGHYKTHHFLSGSHTFIPSKNGFVEVLVVGGGGGGGRHSGGGGGGGGVLYNSAFPVVANTSYTVTVGTGGAVGGTYDSYPTTDGGTGGVGGNSVFGTLTAFGGGGNFEIIIVLIGTRVS
jgi:hypothetical protein